MIDINDLSIKFYNEIVNDIGITDTQILAEHTLYNVKQENLSFPRMIHGIVGYADNDYNYAKDYEYNDIDDTLDREITTVDKVVYRFSIFANDNSASTVFNTINKIHNYYSNDYIRHLDGDIEVLRTSQIYQSLVEKNDQATIGWYFTIDFNIENSMTTKNDYATSIGDIAFNINN